MTTEVSDRRWRDRALGAAVAASLFIVSAVATPFLQNVGERFSKWAWPPDESAPDLRVDVLEQDEKTLKLVVKNYGTLASFINYAVACPPRKGLLYKPDSWDHWDVDDRRHDFVMSSLHFGHLRPYRVGCPGAAITLHVMDGNRHVRAHGESSIISFERPPGFWYFGQIESGPVLASGTLCPLTIAADNQSVPNVFPCWPDEKEKEIGRLRERK